MHYEKNNPIMNLSKNKKVQNFLEEIMIKDPEKHHSLIKMRDIVYDAYPETDEKIMYGGIVFFLKTEMFSGLFANKNHITLEFSKGFLMKDPDKRLEGKGKYRKHLKIRTHADILNKDVAFYVKQVF